MLLLITPSSCRGRSKISGSKECAFWPLSDECTIWRNETACLGLHLALQLSSFRESTPKFCQGWETGVQPLTSSRAPLKLGWTEKDSTLLKIPHLPQGFSCKTHCTTTCNVHFHGIFWNRSYQKSIFRLVFSYHWDIGTISVLCSKKKTS